MFTHARNPFRLEEGLGRQEAGLRERPDFLHRQEVLCKNYSQFTAMSTLPVSKYPLSLLSVLAHHHPDRAAVTLLLFAYKGSVAGLPTRSNWQLSRPFAVGIGQIAWLLF